MFALSFLLIFSCPLIRAQTVSGEPNHEISLVTDFIKLERLRPRRIKEDSLGFANNNPSAYSEETQAFLDLVRSVLSERGALEIDTRARVIIASDKPEQIGMVKQFIRILDQSELTIADLAARSSTSVDAVALKVQLQNLDFSVCRGKACGVAKAQTWIGARNGMLLEVAPQLLSKTGRIEFDGMEKSLTITDTRERVELISRVATLLDHPPAIIKR